VRQTEKGCVLAIKNTSKNTSSDEAREIAAEKLMMAAGRISNADLLKVRDAGIETDERGFVRVNDFLQTNLRHIWAAGDATGRAMFTHAGDKAAELAWHNAMHRKKIRMDFKSVPHAVYTCPQVASVGLTEQAAAKDHDILVGRARYADIVMGEAMMEEEGLAKAIVEKKTGTILGFHIIGPQASILIQEVVNVINKKNGLKELTNSMHIFPALSNIVVETLDNLE
jgi:dihydrolipoamide dehydrogenase